MTLKQQIQDTTAQIAAAREHQAGLQAEHADAERKLNAAHQAVDQAHLEERRIEALAGTGEATIADLRKASAVTAAARTAVLDASEVVEAVAKVLRIAEKATEEMELAARQEHAESLGIERQTALEEFAVKLAIAAAAYREFEETDVALAELCGHAPGVDAFFGWPGNNGPVTSWLQRNFAARPPAEIPEAIAAILRPAAEREQADRLTQQAHERRFETGVQQNHKLQVKLHEGLVWYPGRIDGLDRIGKGPIKTPSRAEQLAEHIAEQARVYAQRLRNMVGAAEPSTTV